MSSAADRLSGSPASKSRYQRLHHHHHHGHHDATVTDGLVEVESTTAAASSSSSSATSSPAIFRGRAGGTGTTSTSSASIKSGGAGSTALHHHHIHHHPLHSSSADRSSSWTPLTIEDANEKERRSDDEGEDDDEHNNDHDHHHDGTHVSLVHPLSPNRSREWGDDEDLQHDEDDDDDMIRRYHTVIQTRVPTLPAEFSGKESRGNATGIGLRLWSAWEETRQGARQRRAARLLNPSDSRQSDFCQTWFCDATNQGIMLAAVLTGVWLLLGYAMEPGPGYWWTGFMLFVLRVSSRSAYQAIQERKRRKKRQSSHAINAANNTSALHHHLGVEMSAENHGKAAYRDQETPLTAPMV